jgi:hypothetical protein
MYNLNFDLAYIIPGPWCKNIVDDNEYEYKYYSTCLSRIFKTDWNGRLGRVENIERGPKNQNLPGAQILKLLHCSTVLVLVMIHVTPKAQPLICCAGPPAKYFFIMTPRAHDGHMQQPTSALSYWRIVNLQRMLLTARGYRRFLKRTKIF